MEYQFTNGTPLQQSLWQEAAGHLLSLPTSAINAKIVVTFQDSIPGGHTDLAATTWTYDSSESSTAVRSDAISWGNSQATMEALAASLGLPYSVEKFYMESAVHELGHSLYASLPEDHRVAIAQMFGAKSDSLEEIQPAGSNWEDRIAEGIAETFKEAFLPRRYRVFPNRTRRKIPYSKFPEFRRLWRLGVEAASGVVTFERDLVAGIKSDLVNPLKNRRWESRSSAVQEINVPTTFHYSVSVPRSFFPDKAEGKGPFTVYGYIQFALRVKDAVTGEVLHFARGAWQFGDFSEGEVDGLNWSEKLFEFVYRFPEPANVPESEDISEGGANHWLMYGEEAVADGRPDFTINHTFSVAAGRSVRVEAWAFFDSQKFADTVSGPLPDVYREAIEALLPQLIYREGGVPGEPIVPPLPTMTPGGAAGASHPHKHPVAANIR